MLSFHRRSFHTYRPIYCVCPVSLFILVCVNIVLVDNRNLAAVLNYWIGNLQTCAIFHWSSLIYFVWKVYMCACNSFILRAWIFQSICYGGFEDGGGDANCWGHEASIENHQYLCIVFLNMHLLFRLMPMLSVGAHLVSWCGWPAILWLIRGVQDKARAGVDSPTAFTADRTRALHCASVNSTALYCTVHLHYWQLSAT